MIFRPTWNYTVSSKVRVRPCLNKKRDDSIRVSPGKCQRFIVPYWEQRAVARHFPTDETLVTLLAKNPTDSTKAQV